MRFLFGNCTLDADRRELRCGGDLVPVEPQVFDLLLHVIRNRDRVVSKDDLLAAVWNGRIVSDSTVAQRINAARRAIGDNGEQQKFIRTLARRGVRFVGEVRDEPAEKTAAAASVTSATPQAAAAPAQQVTFCRSSDGVNLAVATAGDGLPVVKTGTWLTHVEYDWQSPIWSPLLLQLAGRFRLIRQDPRGCGLSDRAPADISFEGFVRDLEAVADGFGLERFALLGISQGAAVSVAYAVRHPDRVSRLVLSGGYPLGTCNRGDAAQVAMHEAMITLIRHGWGQDNPAFRQVFSLRFFPDGTPEQMQWLNDLQRFSTSPEGAIRVRRATEAVDITALLPRVTAPTLVLHSRGDAVVPVEMGRMLASGIPGARYVELESDNHLPLAQERAWPRYIGEICEFLEQEDRGRLRLVTSSGKRARNSA
ncbi:MAG TPA: alpha/beta fold hydrolase [Xanthobacteraceae bacterium]|nr:alpha/beta fold hydrolase [Xanthobacteraceae bacterium]